MPGYSNGMTCLETFAALRIFSSSQHPDTVSRVLGFEATKARPLDPASKYRPKRESHRWIWSSEGIVKSTDGLEHVRAVVDRLEGKESHLADLRAAGCKIDVCCYWVSTGQGGPCLDASTMADLTRLGLDIWWDVYFGDASDYADTTQREGGNGDASAT